MPLPMWERVSVALQRVTETGVPERKAKRGLCNAIANRKIRLRLCFMWRATSETFLTRRDRPTREVHYLKKEEIPSILRPSDFDWRRSRLKRSGLWQSIRGPSGSFFGNWRIIETAHYSHDAAIPHSQRGGRSLAYSLELRSADVTKVFNIAAVAQPKSSTGAKTMGLEEAVFALWPPTGIPPKGLSAKDRNNRIFNWLGAHGYSKPSVRHIQRFLKERKLSRSR